jgi:hypothetical protein
MLQFDFLALPGFFFSTARIASSNTFDKFVLFFAEHSTSVKALILFFNFLASIVVTNFSEFCTRKSDFVPVEMKKKESSINYRSMKEMFKKS